MVSVELVRDIVCDVLQISDRAYEMGPETGLLGNIPEFDSMAVVSVITELEERFDIVVEDDDISAETFESLANLTAFLNSKV